MIAPSFSTYLRYHWSAAGGGRAHARRLAVRYASTTHGPALAQVANRVDDDDRTLANILDALGVRRPRVARTVAVVGERLGRLRPNGRLAGDSAVDPVLDAEIMIAGVVGKRRLWVALAILDDPRLVAIDVEQLVRGADAQIETLCSFHEASVERALRDPTA